MSRRYRIEYLPVAQDDLFDIFDYIQADSPGSAKQFIKKIDRSISKLGSHPEIGKIPKDTRLKLSGYGMLVMDNYIVFYVIKDKTVEIRRILHGRRQYSFLLE